MKKGRIFIFMYTHLFMFSTFPPPSFSHMPQEERSRQIKHFQYFSWPDHGVPNEPGGVLSFLDQVNRAQRSVPDPGPIVVHCR